jgi:hypothetical protein
LARRADRLYEYYAGEQAARLRESLLLINSDNFEQRRALIFDLERSRHPSARGFAETHMIALLYHEGVTIPQGISILKTYQSLPWRPYEYVEVEGRRVKRHRIFGSSDTKHQQTCIDNFIRELPDLPPAQTINEGLFTPVEEGDEPFEHYQIIEQYASIIDYAFQQAAEAETQAMREGTLTYLKDTIEKMPPEIGYWLAVRGGTFARPKEDLLYLYRLLKGHEREDLAFFTTKVELGFRSRAAAPLTDEESDQLEFLHRHKRENADLIAKALSEDNYELLERRLEQLDENFGIDGEPEDTATSLAEPFLVNPIPGPPVAPPVQFISIERITDLEVPIDSNKTRLTRLTEESDILWDEDAIHVLTRNSDGKVEAENIFQKETDLSVISPYGTVLEAQSDGKNIWATTSRGVCLISPEGELLAHFDKDKGLPPFVTLSSEIEGRSHPSSNNDDRDGGYKGSTLRFSTRSPERGTELAYARLSLLPIEIGKCLVFGRFGSPSRNWIALASWDENEGRSSVELIHSCIRRLRTPDYEDAELLAKPEMKDLAFGMAWACLVEDPYDVEARVVLIGRRHWIKNAEACDNLPLMLDLKTWEISVADKRFKGLDDIPGSYAALTHEGSIVALKDQDLHAYYRSGSDEFVHLPITNSSKQSARLFQYENKFYSPGEIWYSVDFSYGVVVDSVAWATIPSQASISGYSSSAMYDLWAVAIEDTPCKIDFKADTSVAVPQLNPYLPWGDIESYLLAAPKIRELGGHVDIARYRTNGDYPTVCLTEEWQGGDEGMQLIKDLKLPINLFLIGAPITDEGMKFLEDVRLSGLHISRTPVTNEGLGHINGLMLDFLSLEGDEQGMTFGDDTLDSFPEISSLRTLRLAGPGFTRDSVFLFAENVNLRHLELYNTSIPEEEAKEYAEISNLNLNWIRSESYPSETQSLAITEANDTPLEVSNSPITTIYLGGQPLLGNEPENIQEHSKQPYEIEMLRQLYLVATRDVFGVNTRDYWLGESLPNNTPGKHFELQVSDTQRWSWNCVLTEMEEKREVQTAAGNIECGFHLDLNIESPWDNAFYRKIAKSIDGVVRLQLNRFGISERPITFHNEAPISEELETLLAKPCFTAQFLAVRGLHNLIRTDGESPERLTALIQGYVNLSFLTEDYLSPMHEVFKARAVLYAARLENKMHEQFGNARVCDVLTATLALTGFHELAALEYAENGPVSYTNPDWLRLGKPYMEYDFAELKELTAYDTLNSWAPLYRLKALFYSSIGDPAYWENERKELQTQHPECVALTLYNTYGAHIDSYNADDAPSRLLGAMIYSELSAIEELPENVSRIVEEGIALSRKSDSSNDISDKEFQLRAKLISELHRAGEQDELDMSWQVLGAMIKEATFSQVAWRAYKLDVMGRKDECAAWISIVTNPMTKEHRLRPLLDCYVDRSANAEQPFEDEGACGFMYRMGVNGAPAPLLHAAGNELTSSFNRNTSRHTGYTRTNVWNSYHDAMNSVRNDVGDDRFRRAGIYLLKTSRNNPANIIFQINWDLDKSRAQIDKYWEAYPELLSVRRAIALNHYEHGEFELAAERLAWVNAKAPDSETIYALAKTYRRLDRVDDLRTLMDDFTAHEEADADSKADALLYTGYDFLAGDDYDTAVEFIEKAAAIDSIWNWRTRSTLAEFNGDSKTAQNAFESFKGNRDDHTMGWYWFCLRWGLDASIPQQRIMNGYDWAKIQYKQTPILMLPEDFIIYLMLTESEEPEVIFEQLKNTVHRDLYRGLHLLMYVLEHDFINEEKMEWLCLHITPSLESSTSPADRIYLNKLSIAIVEDLQDGMGGDLSDQKIEEILRNAPSGEHVNVCYFVGKYLSLCDQEERAVEYWRRAAQSPFIIKTNRTLAVQELRKRGMTTEEYLDLYLVE